MYGLYGLKHHTVEMLPCGTDGRTNDKRQTREDKATQPLDGGRLSFAKGHRMKTVHSMTCYDLLKML